MKIRTIGFTILFVWLMTSRLSAEVGYELPIRKAVEPKVESADFDRIVLDDRTWAAMGVEQTAMQLPPPRKFDFERPPQRFRVEYAEGVQRHSYLTTFPYSPRWLDEAVWPLTRQLFHRGEVAFRRNGEPTAVPLTEIAAHRDVQSEEVFSFNISMMR